MENRAEMGFGFEVKNSIVIFIYSLKWEKKNILIKIIWPILLIESERLNELEVMTNAKLGSNGLLYTNQKYVYAMLLFYC